MPPWLDTAVLVAVVTVAGGTINKILELIFNGAAKKHDVAQKEIMRKLDILQGDNIEIKHDLASNGQELAKVKQNSQDITRYRLFHDMKMDILAGYTTLEHKREIAKLFQSYKMLDGNGEIEMMYREEFIELPLKKEETQ